MMTKELINNNAPQAMVDLANEWLAQGKSFYIGPENIFYYNNATINYHGADDASREHGSWSIHTNDCPVAPYLQMKKEEIEEVAFAFAKGIKPYSATLFLSNKCNSRCFCCSYHGEETEYYDTKIKCEQKTVDLETAKKWVDKLCDMGVQSISIAANGETLVYKHWEELMQYTAQKGLRQYFISNGFMLTENIAKKLAKIGNIDCAEISLHSLDFETWSAVTRTKNKKLFENAINAPILLKKYGIPNVVVAFVKTERNISKLKEFLDYWVKKVNFVSVVHKLSKNEFEQNNSYYNQFNEPRGLCYASYGNIYVFPSGMMLPCGGAYLKYTEENRKSLPFINIEEHSADELNLFLNNLPQDQNFSQICSGCWAQYRRQDLIDCKVFGYPANRDGVSIRVFERNPNTKKTLPEKIKREVNYFVRKQMKKLTK